VRRGRVLRACVTAVVFAVRPSYTSWLSVHHLLVALGSPAARVVHEAS
jgi:hypothetical protein